MIWYELNAIMLLNFLQSVCETSKFHTEGLKCLMPVQRHTDLILWLTQLMLSGGRWDWKCKTINCLIFKRNSPTKPNQGLPFLLEDALSRKHSAMEPLRSKLPNTQQQTDFLSMRVGKSEKMY